LQKNFQKSRAIYEQIIEGIKKMLIRGEFKPGDKLPSQREMAQKLEVNPNTIQRAYREMEVMGLTESRRGIGTYIKEDGNLVKGIKEEMAERSVKNFKREMESLGFSPPEIKDWLKRIIDLEKT